MGIDGDYDASSFPSVQPGAEAIPGIGATSINIMDAEGHAFRYSCNSWYGNWIILVRTTEKGYRKQERDRDSKYHKCRDV